MLTAREYHDLKIVILMDKCQDHAEDAPCGAVCAAIDRVIEQVWRFSELGPKPALTCGSCHLAKPDVRIVEDPFLKEIWNETREVPLCDACYQNSVDDI